MLFDQEFYEENLTGGLHRHHEHWVEQICAQFEPRSVLDIGCGCGYLVQLWRDRGVEAWGIEVSEYALANLCSEYVVKGSFTAIPSPDQQFDVVFSHGVLEYVLDDLPTALSEAKRVGRHQFHTVDLSLNPPEFWQEQFALNDFHNEWV